MRLTYNSGSLGLNEEEENILQRIRERRGSKGLLALDETLLHSPPVASGWNSFFGAIRTQTTLSVSIRETAICRIAVLNKAWYEWDQHAPILRESGVIGEEGLKYIIQAPPFKQTSDNVRSAAEELVDGGAIDGQTPAVQHTLEAPVSLDEAHLVTLAYTDAMTKDVHVTNDLFAQLTKLFSERQIVELTATIASYNCVSRFLVALDVGERNGTPAPQV